MTNDLVDRLHDANPVGRRYCGKLLIDAADEIERLNTTNTELMQHIVELRDKITGADCACSYDNPRDVCEAHSPTVKRLQAELAETKDALERCDRERRSKRQLGYSEGRQSGRTAAIEECAEVAANPNVDDDTLDRQLRYYISAAIRARVKP